MATDIIKKNPSVGSVSYKLPNKHYIREFGIKPDVYTNKKSSRFQPSIFLISTWQILNRKMLKCFVPLLPRGESSHTAFGSFEWLANGSDLCA